MDYGNTMNQPPTVGEYFYIISSTFGRNMERLSIINDIHIIIRKTLGLDMLLNVWKNI